MYQSNRLSNLRQNTNQRYNRNSNNHSHNHSHNNSHNNSHNHSHNNSHNPSHTFFNSHNSRSSTLGVAATPDISRRNLHITQPTIYTGQPHNMLPHTNLHHNIPHNNSMQIPHANFFQATNPPFLNPLTSHIVSQLSRDWWGDLTNQLNLIPSNIRLEQYDTPDGLHVSISHFDMTDNNNNNNNLNNWVRGGLGGERTNDDFAEYVLSLANRIFPNDRLETVINDSLLHQQPTEGLKDECKKQLPIALFKDAKTENENDENSSLCTICQDEYSDDTEVLCLMCTHLFHKHCIYNWFKTSKYCPNCRDDVEATLKKNVILT